MSQTSSEKPAENPNIDLPRWVTEMHIHYQQNGFYRPQDVQRVLGDPGKGVSACASADPSKNGSLSLGQPRGLAEDSRD